MMITTIDELEGLSVADVLELLERGKIGHKVAMEWLGLKSYNDLVRTMHYNGRMMPGHQPMIITRETQELVNSIVRRVD